MTTDSVPLTLTPDDPNFDDILDKLPWHTRNKVLAAMGASEEELLAAQPQQLSHSTLWWTWRIGNVVFWTLFGCIGFLCGLALSVPLVTAPIGISVFLLSCAPAARAWGKLLP